MWDITHTQREKRTHHFLATTQKTTNCFWGSMRFLIHLEFVEYTEHNLNRSAHTKIQLITCVNNIGAPSNKRPWYTRWKLEREERINIERWK